MVFGPAVGFGILASIICVFYAAVVIASYFLKEIMKAEEIAKETNSNLFTLSDKNIKKVALIIGGIATTTYVVWLFRAPQESKTQLWGLFTIIGVIVCIVSWIIPVEIKSDWSKNNRDSFSTDQEKVQTLKRKTGPKTRNPREYLEGKWNSLFGINYECSLWVEEEDLGKEKFISHNNKKYFVKIPEIINNNVILRLRGLGKTGGNKSGDLLLHVWLNKGIDISKNLWLSETSARSGADKKLWVDGKQITMVVPPYSHNGLTIRLKGFGKVPSFSHSAPPLHHKRRGNLFVKLSVFPDSITPRYGSFDSLSTENMALEGWVYRKFDEVIRKMDRLSLPVHPIQSDVIADLYNAWGWMSIFQALVDHLKLTDFNIELTKSASIPMPGSCEGSAIVQDNKLAGYMYRITIKEQLMDNPFFIAAILAHELCHVLYIEKIDETAKSGGYVIKTDKATLEEERTVDLLVFMFRMGEFQLRVARDERLTLGYFNQEIFERIQVIVSRKLNSY